MPKQTRQRKHSLDAIRKRWSGNCSNDDNSSDSVLGEKFDVSGSEIESTNIDFSAESVMDATRDLFSFCNERAETRALSVLIYFSLRMHGVSWRNVDLFLSKTGGITAQTAHKWSEILLNDGFDEFFTDSRGGKRFDSFWDTYPDLEVEARNFVVEECSKRESNFTAEALAKFIDDRYYVINELQKANDKLIRSIESCRLDLRRFGARFTSNKNRPYYIGHERDDVVKHRQEFCDFFVKHEKNLYSITEEETPCWDYPIDHPTILICMNISYKISIVVS